VSYELKVRVGPALVVADRYHCHVILRMSGSRLTKEEAGSLAFQLRLAEDICKPQNRCGRPRCGLLDEVMDDPGGQ
jgi:hypothetical protein